MIRYENYDLVIVGGGAAGIAAAVHAYELGIKNILLVERDPELGGILQQCIHNGFGLHVFKEELTGPEYVEKWLELLPAITVKLNASVLSITEDKKLYIQAMDGMFEVQTKSIICSVGCMERPRGAISIPGPRVSGIMTAGAAQRFLNINGQLPGKKVVILGSGDIGLIMARRMTLEGAKVLGVYEVMPYSTGLIRNVVQCLHDYHIPLSFSKTIYKVHGVACLEGVTLINVDENRQPIIGTEEYLECDTLLLSVGLIPVTDLLEEAGVMINPSTKGPIVNHLMETNVDGIFACGNVLHVHDLVDNVSAEGKKAALGASFYLNEDDHNHPEQTIKCGQGLIYVVPRSLRIDTEENFYEVLFRVQKPLEGMITIKCGDQIIVQHKSKHLSPGEMEKVILPKSKISNTSDEIVISVEV